MRTYHEALAFLDQYANYELNRSVPYAPKTFDLARIEGVLARLGNPHRAYKVVHVAGTKGKGSTCCLIESALRAAGYRTGLYTSPHLQTFRERIQVDGRLIAPEQVAALVDELEPHIAAVPSLTYFEIVTALGLVYFSRRHVDVAVVEVGLGGRLDATNVVRPEVSVITSLSLDHMAWLGDTLDKIAFEKAGIIKPGVPVVSAPQPPEASAVIERVAAERNAPLTLIGRAWLYAPGQIQPDGQWFTRLRPEWYANFAPVPECYWLALLGRHQIVNATVALAALDVLRERGLNTSAEAVERGLRDVRWPARLEVLSRDPLAVVDGAHNGESAQRLRAALEEWFPRRQWTLIFGASSDKDFAAMFDALLPVTARLILTRARSVRAADPERLAELAEARGQRAEFAQDVAAAIESAMRAVGGQGDSTPPGIIITGSLFIAAEAEAAWAARTGAPWADL